MKRLIIYMACGWLLASHAASFASTVESGDFVLDTRLSSGLSCEWLTPTNGESFRIGMPIAMSARLTRTADATLATNAGVQVKLFLTNGTSYYSAYLMDDGVTGADTNAGDGIYSGTLGAPTRLSEGDYVLDLYAGYPKWMNDPAFVRSQQIVHIGDGTTEFAPVTLDLTSSQTDPYLIGHGISATATLHCPLDDVLPGSTTVHLKVIAPSGNALRLQMLRDDPYSLIWSLADSYMPSEAGEHEFCVEVRRLSSGDAWSDVQSKTVFLGIGELNHWFSQPTGVQWEPFSMGVTTVREGGGPITDASVIATVTGTFDDSLRMGTTTDGGIARADFVPPKAGDYQVTFSVDSSDYYFPHSSSGNFSVVVNDVALRQEVDRFVQNAINAVDTLGSEAELCASDAEYLYPFAVDDAGKTDFLQNLAINLAGTAISAGIDYGAAKMVSSCPFAPGIQDATDRFALNNYGTAKMGPFVRWFDPMAAYTPPIDTWSKSMSASFASLAVGESLAGDVGSYWIEEGLSSQPDPSEIAESLRGMFGELLEEGRLYYWARHDYREDYLTSATVIYETSEYLKENWPAVPAGSAESLIANLDLKARAAVAQVQIFEDSAAFVHKVQRDRHAWDHDPATKFLDWFKYAAADAAANTLLPGIGHIIVDAAEAWIEAELAADRLAIEGGAINQAVLLFSQGAIFRRSIEADAAWGMASVLQADEPAGTIQAAPTANVDCDLWAFESGTVQAGGIELRCLSRFAEVDLQNTSDYKAAFAVSAHRSYDGPMRVDYPDKLLILDSGEIGTVYIPLDIPTTDPVELDPTTFRAPKDGRLVELLVLGHTAQGAYFVRSLNVPMRFRKRTTLDNSASGDTASTVHLWNGATSSDSGWPVFKKAARGGDAASSVLRFTIMNPLSYPVSCTFEQPVPASLGVVSAGSAECTSSSMVWRCSLSHGQSVTFDAGLRLIEPRQIPTALPGANLRIAAPGGSNTVVDLSSTPLPSMLPISVGLHNVPFEFVRGVSYDLQSTVSNLVASSHAVTTRVSVADAELGSLLTSNVFEVALNPASIVTNTLSWTPAAESNVVLSVSLAADPSNALVRIMRAVRVDSDSDGMPDYWETSHGLNPYWPGDAGLDDDDDTLSNLVEYRLQTNPGVLDSDFDGVSDPEELAAGTNPAYAGWSDSDGDGLRDDWERRHFVLLTYQTGQSDADGDGLNNRQELVFGTDPNAADTDGDGQSDYDEYWGGSNPLNPASVFGISSFTRTDGVNRFTVRAGSRSDYQLTATTNLLTPFSPRGDIVPGSILGTLEMTDTTISNSPAYFRIKAIPNE